MPGLLHLNTNRRVLKCLAYADCILKQQLQNKLLLWYTALVEHNVDHYKQIILNNRPGGYRPNRALFESLRAMFPDINILGFGKFSPFLWYVMASSKSFPENLYNVETTVYYHQILMWIPKKPTPPSAPNNPVPPMPGTPTAS